jgi:Fuc2NAc and GlcNAc transferase
MNPSARAYGDSSAHAYSDVLVMVELTVIAMGALVFALSVLLTGVVRRFALASGLVDVPNPRSSHTRATARGGGLAVVFAATAGVGGLYVLGVVSRNLALTVVIGGGVVAVVGFLDDRYSVRPAARFTVHACAALYALVLLGGLPPLPFGDHLIKLGAAGYVIGVLGIVWVLNLFNFMDGIDGIAAAEAVFIACAGAFVGVMGGSAREVQAAALVLAFASAGFLCWNWPPAKVFLGDVGSGYLGYVIAVFALTAARADPVALWVWLILGGVFFVDATITLSRRLLRGERVFEAHRSHAYQWLARRWNSHGKVTLGVVGINLVWLLPWSVLAEKFPKYAILAVVAALGPLALVAAMSGAGSAERAPRPVA